MANTFDCVLDFDDIDLSSPVVWRKRLIDVIQDPLFETLMGDLATTNMAIDSASVTRDVGGSCGAHAEIHSGGGGGSIGLGCSIRF